MTAYPNNNKWLKHTIQQLGVTRARVADALLVNTSTVDRWLQPRTRKGQPNGSWRKMPDMARELMKYRIRDDCFLEIKDPPTKSA